MSIFICHDTFNGTISCFAHSTDADRFADSLRLKVHQDTCINKINLPNRCICDNPTGVECSSHTYARTVKSHSIQECTIAADIYVEEHQIR